MWNPNSAAYEAASTADSDPVLKQVMHGILNPTPPQLPAQHWTADGAAPTGAPAHLSSPPLNTLNLPVCQQQQNPNPSPAIPSSAHHSSYFDPEHDPEILKMISEGFRGSAAHHSQPRAAQHPVGQYTHVAASPCLSLSQPLPPSWGISPTFHGGESGGVPASTPAGCTTWTPNGTGVASGVRPRPTANAQMSLHRPPDALPMDLHAHPVISTHRPSTQPTALGHVGMEPQKKPKSPLTKYWGSVPEPEAVRDILKLEDFSFPHPSPAVPTSQAECDPRVAARIAQIFGPPSTGPTVECIAVGQEHKHPIGAPAPPQQPSAPIVLAKAVVVPAAVPSQQKINTPKFSFGDGASMPPMHTHIHNAIAGNGSAGKDVQICLNHVRGVCQRGSMCRYWHPVDDGRMPPDACVMFWHTGWCQYGTGCRDRHVENKANKEPPPPPAEPPTKKPPLNAFLWGMPMPTPVEVKVRVSWAPPPPSPPPRPPCNGGSSRLPSKVPLGDGISIAKPITSPSKYSDPDPEGRRKPPLEAHLGGW